MELALDDYRWLVSEAVRPWLERASDELASAPGAALTWLNRARKDLSAARAHLVVEQIELRQRAKGKFALAERMFFTRKGLEQATDEQVAACKASRFPAGQRAVDLCCGIGGDALALARSGPVVGVDCDVAAGLLAEANARACGWNAESLQVQCLEAASVSVGSFAAWHIDPDRRPQGRRTTRVELYQPPLETIESLRTANANAAVKLAPAAIAPESWRESAELQWLGSRGECRQQVAWFGSLARHPGRRSATIVDAAGGPYTIVGDADEPIPIAAALGCYLYEPHAAILAAHLTGAICRQHHLAAVSPGIAYLTADHHVSDPGLAAFEVQEVLPFDQKQLKAWCREHRIGQLEIKKRGIDFDPERLRKTIIGTGDNAATLIVTPHAGRTRTIVAARIV